MKKIVVAAVAGKIVAAVTTLVVLTVSPAYAAPAGELEPARHSARPGVSVECWEDLTCSDGTRLASWDCRRPTFVDVLGRVVRSNGRCGPA